MSGSRCAASHSANGFPAILRRGSQFSAGTGLDRRPQRTLVVMSPFIEVHPSMKSIRKPLASPYPLPGCMRRAPAPMPKPPSPSTARRSRAAIPARVLPADSRAGRAERDGRAGIRAGARRPRHQDQAGPLAAVVHGRRGAHRSDHGDVHVADAIRRRACSSRTSSSTW